MELIIRPELIAAVKFFSPGKEPVTTTNFIAPVMNMTIIQYTKEQGMYFLSFDIHSVSFVFSTYAPFKNENGAKIQLGYIELMVVFNQLANIVHYVSNTSNRVELTVLEA